MKSVDGVTSGPVAISLMVNLTLPPLQTNALTHGPSYFIMWTREASNCIFRPLAQSPLQAIACSLSSGEGPEISH